MGESASLVPAPGAPASVARGTSGFVSTPPKLAGPETEAKASGRDSRRRKRPNQTRLDVEKAMKRPRDRYWRVGARFLRHRRKTKTPRFAGPSGGARYKTRTCDLTHVNGPDQAAEHAYLQEERTRPRAVHMRGFARFRVPLGHEIGRRGLFSRRSRCAERSGPVAAPSVTSPSW